MNPEIDPTTESADAAEAEGHMPRIRPQASDVAAEADGHAVKPRVVSPADAEAEGHGVRVRF